MLGPIYKPLFTSMYKRASEKLCYVYDFDGVDDYAVLNNRAIDIEGDNYFEFFSPNFTAATHTIIAQNISSSLATQEFQLYVTGVSQLGLCFGGSALIIFTPAQGFKAATRYGLTIIGTEVNIYEGGLSGVLVHSTTFTRGAAREPTAKTMIGCRSNGVGVYFNFFSGLQYDVRINGVLWKMGARNQVIQQSTPEGNQMTFVNTINDRWQEAACRAY